ncbi:hypothetical protein H6G64_35495 [Calothrix sp. FACHB-156]|nr:hypothetical protein [Calothrix sp. FACHB-156]
MLRQQILSDYATKSFRASYAAYLPANNPPVNYWISSRIPCNFYPAYFSELSNAVSTTSFYKIREAIKRLSKTKGLIYSQNASNAIYPEFLAGSYSRQTYFKNSSETEQLSKDLSEKVESLKKPKTPRPLGIWKGKVKIADDFDDCLNEIDIKEEKTPRPLGIWKGKVKIADDFDDCLNEITNDL